MDELIATLFGIYFVLAVLSAVIQRLRGGPGRSLPPAAGPLEEATATWPSPEPPARPERREPLPLERPQPQPAEGGETPGPETLRPPAAEPPDRRWQDLPSPAAPRREAPGQRHRRAMRLSARSLREAVIVSELLAPPRALRPYTPFPQRRAGK